VTRTYWELIGTFTCAAGEYAGRWFDEQFARPAAGKAIYIYPGTKAASII